MEIAFRPRPSRITAAAEERDVRQIQNVTSLSDFQNFLMLAAGHTGQILNLNTLAHDAQDWRCDGIIDEGCGCPVGQRRDCYDGPAGTAGVGICRAGSQSCVATATSASWPACAGQVLPAAVNACDGQDNLCNGMPYSGCSCTPGESRPCYDGPPGTENVGLCIPGSQSCQIVNDVPTWGACTGQVVPAPNTCDGVDRMCTGNPNSGGCGCVIGPSRPCYDGAPGTAGVGVCVGGNQTCETGPGGAGSVWGMCVGQVIATPNTCDGIISQHLTVGLLVFAHFFCSFLFEGDRLPYYYTHICFLSNAFTVTIMVL